MAQPHSTTPWHGRILLAPHTKPRGWGLYVAKWAQIWTPRPPPDPPPHSHGLSPIQQSCIPKISHRSHSHHLPPQTTPNPPPIPMTSSKPPAPPRRSLPAIRMPKSFSPPLLPLHPKPTQRGYEDRKLYFIKRDSKLHPAGRKHRGADGTCGAALGGASNPPPKHGHSGVRLGFGAM